MEKTTTLHPRVPVELYVRLQEQARKENRSLSNMTRHALAQYLERVRQGEELVERETRRANSQG